MPDEHIRVTMSEPESGLALAVTVTGYDMLMIADVTNVDGDVARDIVPYAARFIVYVYVIGVIGSFVVITTIVCPPAGIATAVPHCTDDVAHVMPLMITVPPTNEGAKATRAEEDGRERVYERVEGEKEDTIEEEGERESTLMEVRETPV